MKKINGWLKLGLFLSITWIVFATFIYVDELVNYPNSIDEKFSLWLGDHFIPGEDKNRREEMLAYAKAHGTEAEAHAWFALGLGTKPCLSISGYFKLVLLPITHPRKILTLIKASLGYGEIQEDVIINPIVALIFLLLGILIFLGSILLIICASIFISWLLLKKVIYKLVYISTKAIEDARKDLTK